MKTANEVRRMTNQQKERAEFEVQIFSQEAGYFFDEIERTDGEWSGTIYTFENGDIENGAIEYEGVAIVRCPSCNEIQACWGQYGDPETEICICSQCNEEYKTEW